MNFNMILSESENMYFRPKLIWVGGSRQKNKGKKYFHIYFLAPCHQKGQLLLYYIFKKEFSIDLNFDKLYESEWRIIKWTTKE